MLQPPLGIRVVRLPYQAVKPITAPSYPLEALLCASAPDVVMPPGAVEALLRCALAAAPRACRVHVFADEQQRPRLADFARHASHPEREAMVYHPAAVFSATANEARVHPAAAEPQAATFRRPASTRGRTGCSRPWGETPRKWCTSRAPPCGRARRAT
jgi:hypothetical protein